VLTVAADLIADCDQAQAETVLNVGDGTGAQSFLIESNSLEFVVVNTIPPVSPGPVTVQPVDTTTGGTPATVTFSGVTSPGATSLTTAGAGPPAPANFSVGNPPVFYDISTTAGYTPPVTVCVHWTQGAFGSDAAEAGLRFFHFEGAAWADVTTASSPGHANPDTVGNQICGSVTTLSPFAAFASAGQNNRPPTADAGADQTVIVGGVVTLHGSASDPDNGPGPLTLQWSQASGPPVALSSSTASTPTFTPAKVGTYGLTLTARDGDLTSAPDSTTVTAQYKFGGFDPPLGKDTFKTGSTIPVKFKLFNAKGAAVGTAVATLRFVKPPATTPAVTAIVPFDKKESKYQFDLKTKGLSAGTWRLDVVLDDGTTYSITVKLRD
jgi:hypothetical protein